MTAAFVPAVLVTVVVDALPWAAAALLVLPLLLAGTMRYTRVESALPSVVAMVALALLTTALLALAVVGAAA